MEQPAGASAARVSWPERQVRRFDRFQQRHAVVGFPLAVVQKFGNDQAHGKATLMAYYGLFALFPLLLLFVTVLGFVLSSHPGLRQLMVNSTLGNFPVIGDQIRSQVHPLTGNVTALIIGIVGSVYGALGIGLAAQNAMNTVWNIPFVYWPSLWKRYLRTIGVIALLGLASLGSTALAAVATVVGTGIGATAVAVVSSMAVNFGLFLLAFMLLTAQPLRVREVVLGAAVATAFWETLQLIGTWYVSRGLAHAQPTYGFFAVAIALLSWLFLGAQLTLWAAEINVVRRYRLWPRSLTQPPLTRADRLVFERLARMEQRRPEVRVAAAFTDEADRDPLDRPTQGPD